jgi:hypothetical protein
VRRLFSPSLDVVDDDEGECVRRGGGKRKIVDECVFLCM